MLMIKVTLICSNKIGAQAHHYKDNDMNNIRTAILSRIVKGYVRLSDFSIDLSGIHGSAVCFT